MTRGIWVGLVVCTAGVGCSGPQYYPAPPEKMPGPTTINGVVVQLIDERPDWEKKPFLGVVCLYHIGKAHPDGWAQLFDETTAIVAALPQKPERVEVVVTSFQLVRSGDTSPRFRDFSSGPNVNPAIQSQGLSRTGTSDSRDQMGQMGQSAATSGTPPPRPTGDAPPNRLEMAFAAKDDPRRKLTEHPAGASCSMEATVKLVYAGGTVKTVPIKVLRRAPNDSGTDYWGQAIDNAAKQAIFDFGRQFRAGVGVQLN